MAVRFGSSSMPGMHFGMVIYANVCFSHGFLKSVGVYHVFPRALKK